MGYTRATYKYFTIIHNGGIYVIMNGTSEMLKLFADNWGTTKQSRPLVTASTQCEKDWMIWITTIHFGPQTSCVRETKKVYCTVKMVR